MTEPYYFILWEVQGQGVFKTCLLESLDIAKAFRENLLKNSKIISAFIVKYEYDGVYTLVRV